MNKTWKWILGIILVLVVVAVLVAVPFAMRRYMLANNSPNSLPQAPGWNGGPMMPGNNGWQHPQVPGWQGSFNGRAGPMMGRGRGFNRGFGLMVIGGFLCLIPLALFALLLFGVFQLGKRSGTRSNLALAGVPTQPAPPAASVPETNETPAA